MDASKQKKKSSRLSMPQNRVRQRNLKTITDLEVYDFEKVRRRKMPLFLKKREGSRLLIAVHWQGDWRGQV
jgi:hypothetical protein